MLKHLIEEGKYQQGLTSEVLNVFSKKLHTLASVYLLTDNL